MRERDSESERERGKSDIEAIIGNVYTIPIFDDEPFEILITNSCQSAALVCKRFFVKDSYHVNVFQVAFLN